MENRFSKIQMPVRIKIPFLRKTSSRCREKLRVNDLARFIIVSWPEGELENFQLEFHAAAAIHLFNRDLVLSVSSRPFLAVEEKKKKKRKKNKRKKGRREKRKVESTQHVPRKFAKIEIHALPLSLVIIT